MLFTEMQNAVDLILTQIYKHAFIQELAQGTLAKGKFIFYLEQDALYLADFSRALALVAARCPDRAHAQQFMQFALQAIAAEQELHGNYFKKYGKSPQLTAQQSPACFMYTNYILKMTSIASIEEAVASLLPCFWIYREVGKQIVKQAQANNPYQDWIDLYSGEAFDASVNTAIAITNELSKTTASAIREKMLAAFIRSAQLEWLFWDSAYQLEKWLI